MDDYLRSVDCRLGVPDPCFRPKVAVASKKGLSDKCIHAVLGGPEANVDTVAATLCLALHLSQTQPSAGVSVPLLYGRRGDATSLPRETLAYLHKIKVCESLLLWKDDLDLIKIHRAGKLSVTLLRNGLLDGSECHTLDSSILRVVHHHDDDDDDDDCGLASAAVTVATELLQEAPERVGAVLRESLGEALRLQSEAFKIKHGHRSEQLHELLRRLERCSDSKGGLPGLEHLLSKELKEFSDGETTIALTSVTLGEERGFGYEDALKSFCNRHGYDGLMLLLAVENAVSPPRLQVVVCSNNTELLNQICCELQQTTSWSLSGETGTRSCLQVYQVQPNAFSPSGTSLVLLEEDVRGLLKEFVDRRSSVLACHPTSRTSSTEGVAGSVEFSQGSSGINDMDGSDTERADGGGGDSLATEREAPEGEDDPGGVRVSGELVSPDSGMNTIRSSRSSKESSVFLSDDSPVAEMIGSVAGAGGLLLRNPSPLGLLSLSPPAPPERRRRQHSSKKRNDNIDQFHFDPLHPHYVLHNSAGKADDDRQTVGSSSLSEYEEVNMVDFSNHSSLGRLESRQSSPEPDCQIMEMMDTVVPPTPVNSLVGGHPSTSCGARFFPEDVAERITGLQHKDSVSSSLSETWEELGFDTPTSNDAWTRIRGSESPQNLEEVRCKESDCGRLSKEGRSQRDWSMEPQLSLITEQTETCDNWNPDSVIVDQWNTVSAADLQLTPPEEELDDNIGVFGVKKTTRPSQKKKMVLNTLTPETSKEENDDAQGGKARSTMQTLDFWTYTEQKGFLKSDSGTTTSYPESLDMWNTTIRDDSFSPLTTPDNLSEDSGNFGATTPSMVGSASVESPQGFPYGGMEMWNTTIQEDSSSSASPEGPGNGKLDQHPGLADAKDTPSNEQQGEAERVKHGENVRWTDQKHNIKIFIDEEEGRISDKDDLESAGHLPVPHMVISTSDYDNVGGCSWSISSSPEIHCDPVVNMIQLEEQSSPFIAVTKPIEDKTESDGCTSEKIFLFEGQSDLISVEKTESVELRSPFILVDNSKTLSKGPQSIEDSLSRSPGSSMSLASTKAESSGPVSPSNSLPPRVTLRNQECSTRDAMSPSPGIDGDTLKFSPGSRDELRSNSDGDSSSCLEMEYIIVPGTAKADEHDVKETEGLSKRPEKPMETFDMLSYTVSVLKAQNQETPEKSGPTQNDQSTTEDQNRNQATSEAFCHSKSRPTLESENEFEEGHYDDKSSVFGRSISPSLRHPSDHFLRTREEVYVHSQISMEDSGSDSGHSPINNPTLPDPDFQVWGDPLERQSSSCNSSAASHTSSLVSTPASESGIPRDKTLGLPFSGDLMEEENEEGQEEEPKTVPSSYDLLSFTEELVESRPLPSNSGPFQKDLLDYYGQSERTDDCLVGHHDGDWWGSRQSCSQNLECQNTTSQFLPHPANRQWTTAHGPSPTGYNYHHIDQRTGNHEACEPPRNASGVYAEFSTQVPLADFAAGRDDSYFEPCHGDYKHSALDDHVQYVPEGYDHFLTSRREHHEDQYKDQPAAETAMTTMMMMQRASSEEAEDTENREDPPSSADVSAGSSQRRKLVAPPMNVSLEHSEGSLLSEDALDTDEEEAALDTGDDLDVDIEELDTSEEERDTTVPPSGDGEGHEDGRLWRSVVIGEQEHRIDMKCIEAYKRVISHGGYYAEQNAIIVFAACFLPDSDCDSYNYVMENLFLYVISTLELMVAEDYMIVYLNGATPRRRMPGFTWMKKCYQMIDRRLKKNLKMFIIVHPSWFIRTLLGITRPFISSKFSSKIKYVSSLQELGQIIPMEYVHIPQSIIKLDTDLMDTSGKSDGKRSLAI
ncbi:uncharacterized protein LOC130912954 isoform X2 [Corythoichthys intestinalis]|uniref:uncharacterized protein LOC130912954 isoform X2 n=1 Tax=Corythoichthys intestinalis TaxID=161448 RepID=UPI0025A53A83|nr:uncharacterized protein LOC130912954 isoform X2 [Corythoichthys intestinalis]